jgi:DNA-binding response OmpR family regulator
LVADDEADLRESIVDLLDSEGWKVTAARDGREAAELALRVRPHFMVLDQRMPGLTGTEVVESLRKGGLDPTVLLITAASGAAERARALGISHLPKPFAIDDLIAHVNAYCDAHGHGPESACD